MPIPRYSSNRGPRVEQPAAPVGREPYAHETYVRRSGLTGNGWATLGTGVAIAGGVLVWWEDTTEDLITLGYILTGIGTFMLAVGAVAIGVRVGIREADEDRLGR